MFHRPRLIPTLLLDGAGLVKTIQYAKPRYIGDPINTIKIFNGKGVDELCVLDISASREGKEPNWNMLSQVATEAFMPLSYGGGITTVEQVQRILYIGFEKIIVNTAFCQDPTLVRHAANHAGSQSIVVSIDVKTDFFGRYSCYACAGSRKIRETPASLAKLAQYHGAGEILLNSITNDGMMQGYDLELIKLVSEAVDIPVIANCGAAGAADMKKALDAGASAVAAGSMYIYYGRMKAVLISAPREDELVGLGIYGE
jgi:cyclase